VPSNAAEGSARDIWLVRAAGILFFATLLELVGESVRFGSGIDTGIAGVDLVSSLVGLLSRPLVILAVVFGLVAFRSEADARRRWLRWAFLITFLAFGLDFVSRIIDFAAIDDPAPQGYRVGLGAGVLATFFLAAGSLLAASAYTSAVDLAARDAGLRRAALSASAAFLLSAISAFELAVAYSEYPHHNRFVGGLVYEGLGSLVAALALLLGGRAFRLREGDKPSRWPAARERCLFAAATALAFAYLVIGLAEGKVAAGTSMIGYARSSVVSGWVFAAAHFLYAGAVVCAALGFRRAADQRD